MQRIKFIFLGTLVSWMLPARAMDPEFTAGGSLTEGYYGRATSTQIVQTPLSVAVRGQPWKIKLTAIWLHVDGPREDNSLYPLRDAAGWSDAYIHAAYYFVPWQRWLIALQGQIKIPLNTFTSGLSTGGYDAGPQLGLYFAPQPRLTLFTLGSMWYRQSPPAVVLERRRQLLIGSLWRVGEVLSVGASADYISRATADSVAQKQVSIFLPLNLGSAWLVTPYALTGFSRASARWGIGAEIQWRWRH